MIGWLVLLLRGMFQQVPESITSVEVSVIVIKRILQDFERGGAKISPLVDTALNDLLHSQSTHPQENQQFMTCKKDASGILRDEAPDDFRKLSILPTSVELQSDYKPFLRTNIVNGCYDNVHHYLDVHFRLLREDFVQPLREGIAEYVAKINQRGDAENKRFQNLRLYDDVQAIDITPSQDGFVYDLQFAINNNLKRVRWELSKRLIYGSLVCLSRDDFKTFIFGYVAKRDIRELSKGRVAVTINISDEESRDLFSFPFKMAESSSYFEAYRHVLRSLQTIDQENFPLKQYLISVPNDVSLPKYIGEKPDLKFTLCCNRIGQINKESEKMWRPSTTQPVEVVEKQVQVSMEKTWPGADELGFDDSQMKAFKAALREEICLIQGPPGTGKTYVGLKIVETLLKNKSHWGNKPLLVVCYTNHALDQFLEGILQISRTRVVRIGGRSSSDEINKVNLSYVTKEISCKDPDLRGQYRVLRDNLKKCARNVESCKYFIATARKKILKYRLLLPSMSGLHLQSLARYQGRYPEIDVLIQWLCIVDENGQLKDRPLEQFNQRRQCDMYHFHNQQEFIENADNRAFRFDYDDDEFDRLPLDDEDELIRDIFDNHHTAENENIAVEIPANYINQQGELIPQPQREQIEELIESTLWEPDIMTQEEAHAIIDICRLDVRHRWRLYRFWVQLFIEETQRQLRKETEQFRTQKETFDAFRLREQVAALQGVSVIGVTTTGAAKHQQLLRHVGPPIVIIEEAAEVLEAHVITSLTSDCQHLILIGDHQQLRPNPTVYELCKHYKLDVSLFERLIRNGMPYQRLKWQHRMRPEISHLLKVHEGFYPDLSDHLSVKNYEGVRGIEKNVFFLDHDYQEQGNDESKTHSNLHEAAFLISLCNYLLQQGYTSKQITILTAYRGQMWNIKDLRKGKGLEEVRVCPIDNFQGEENDIILVSFVRSNEEGKIGFLKVPNRVCMNLSRAKKGLYCVGNFTLMSKCSNLWKVIVKDLQKRESIGRNLKLLCRNHQNIYTEVSHADDFAKVSDGGCSEPCNARLNCGHTCQKKCHPEDKEHRDIRCMKPCVKKCKAQIHKCRKYCYQKCKEPCTENTKKVLPCSHEQLAECYLLPKEVKCMSKCEKKLPCNHQCQRLCYERCTEKCGVKLTKIFQPCGHQLEVPCFQTECSQACETLLKCNHSCSGTCGQCRNDRFHVKCEKRCTRILVCGHVCESKCSSTCPPCKKPCKNRCKHNECIRPCGEMCIPCIEPCPWECRHLRCKTKCGDACDRKPCDRTCRKKLKCGHSCIGLCGEPCPLLCRRCNKDEVTMILFGNEDEPGAKVYIP
ncbi:NFX1-type zinc finger-containing protein 1 [Holothuria leucospilota]|uniref:NFX1-type zinc finger-containing protein 1 n=1 Tax=Holothuria leucospilota TaxID=206669 RepID=A0A9Q1CCF6_HOLLE|nr:NFX1-type zinc finger-containing protein 1 [Holothuria leucospilota]